MANSNEIAQIDAINKGLTSLNDTLNKTASNYLTLVKTIESGSKVIQDSTKNEEELVKAKKKTVEADKEKDAQSKALAASEQKLLTFDAAVYEQIQRNNKALADNKKAINDKIKASEAEEGSLVRMRQELIRLTKEYDSAAVRTKEAANQIKNLSREIGEAEEATNRGQRSVGQYGKMLDGLKSLLPALGIGAIVAGIGTALNSIKNSTHATADAFEFEVAGMVNGLDFFWKTLATGNWTNFMTNMKEAIKAGRDYAETIDKIQEQTRALSILESEKLQENIDLEIELRNKTLTPEQRQTAGLKRIANEEEFVKQRSFIANESYTNDLNEAIRVSKLSEDQLKTVAKDINSQKRLDAEEYQQRKDKLKKMEDLNTSSITTAQGGQMRVQSEDTPEIIAQRELLKNTNKSIIEYADLLQKWDIIDEKSQIKFVESYVKKNEASVSGKENLKKIYSQVNMLTKTMSDDEIKAAKDAKDAKEKNDKEKLLNTISNLELSNSKEKVLINQNYVNGLTSNEQYQAELLAQEVKFLNIKQSLYKKDSKEWLEIETEKQSIAIKISDDKLKAKADEAKAFKQADDDAMAELQKALKEQADFEEKTAKETADTKRMLDKEELKTKAENAKKVHDIQIQFATQAINGILDINKQRLDQELSDLDKQKQKELSNKNLTEAQKAKIEADYDKKANAIKAKQAQNDKLKALFDIAINTAVNAAKEAANPIMMAWVIAMGAMQAALVMARPIPKFAKGTLNAPERGIFGESGREIMFPVNGSAIIADKATYFEGSKFKGARIYSNPETERLIGSSNRNVQGNQIDERLLNEMRATRKAIQDKPVILMDENYRAIGTKTPHSQTVILNRLLRNN